MISEVTFLTWHLRTADLTRQEMSRHYCLHALLGFGALLIDPAARCRLALPLGARNLQ
jgi:hypothetical protein